MYLCAKSCFLRYIYYTSQIFFFHIIFPQKAQHKLYKGTNIYYTYIPSKYSIYNVRYFSMLHFPEKKYTSLHLIFFYVCRICRLCKCIALEFSLFCEGIKVSCFCIFFFASIFISIYSISIHIRFCLEFIVLENIFSYDVDYVLREVGNKFVPSFCLHLGAILNDKKKENNGIVCNNKK